jgi:sialate O-acetylesterase
MKNLLSRLAAVVFLLGVFSPLLFASPVLPGLFSDHMVLQRDREIPVWGWADPGERITVTLNGDSQSTDTGYDGRWQLTLPSQKAGGPFVLTVQGKKTITLKDVMVGEVWVLSGQSNMTFALSGAATAATAIPAAKYPEIRLFTVPQERMLTPEQNPASTWKICTPDSAKLFTAVGYFFGRELYQKLGVPIGLIHSAWPGTVAEDWASPESLRGPPELQPILRRWAEAPAQSKQLAEHPADFDLEFDDFELIKSNPSDPLVPFSNFNDGTARNSLQGLWTYDWQAAPDSIFELSQPGRGGSGYAARVYGQLSYSDDSLLHASFSPDGSPANMSQYAGLRFYYRGAGYFHYRSLQPSIYDYDDYISQPFQASKDWQDATIWFKDLHQAGWGIPEPLTLPSLSGFDLEALQAPSDVALAPSSLFNGMIAPLIPFAIRGAVWYQGESNAPRAYQYRTLLPALIRGWRQAWGEGDFPFLIVQLPNFGQRREQPGEDAWAELREAQLMALRLPNTGLAVTIDLGEANNLHPPRKAEVGERLALWALGTTYHRQIVYSGPLYSSMQTEGNQITVHFNHVGGGLAAHGTSLRGFAIAGADRVFHWANASIQGNAVVVSSPEVPSPVAVRYAWDGNPDCNLYNQAGLPASPFRTDNWPGVTINAK